MPSPAKLLALAAVAPAVSATFQGFNYGATFADGRLKVESDFEAHFTTAQKLAGTDGKFNSARLYTMIQGGTDNEPISAIPAAIKTKTSILFGLWASAGGDTFNNEIAALQKTIDQYCDQLDGLIAGISVGSEDLYRDSPIGRKAGEFAGAGPSTLVNYIAKVRKVIKGTCMESAPIGHVDTWTAYVNETNKPLIEACDWVGMDAYPYYESTKPNAIEDAKGLFDQALANTKGASGDKPVWITETGYPVSGKTSGAAVANPKNARTYWEDVGCSLFGKTNTWWYTLQNSNSDKAIDEDTPSFGVVGQDLNAAKPNYNLSCKGVKPKPVTTSSTPEATTSKSSEDSTETKTKSGDDEELETAPEKTTAAPASSGTAAADGSKSDGDKSETGSGSSPSPVPDAGSQLKGSFGAVVVALGLAFLAL